MCLNSSLLYFAGEVAVDVSCVGFEEVFKKDLKKPSTPNSLIMLISERKSYTF